jgi:ABC-type multidrug transport system ATPase subunit
VPERFPGGLPFSAREYLLHMARVHGMGGAAGRRAADEWLERLGAAGYSGAPLRSLSKGMCQKVAIAQAFLSRPGLLVLDEAWTGLDQAARGTLDAAVTERVTDGAIALFVDHDPARLAGRASQRWQLGDAGRVTVAADDDGSPAGPRDGTVVVIEVDGLDRGSLARARDLPGVLAADPGSAGRAVIRVTGDQCDGLLRTVLSWDGAHVHAVRGQPAARPGPERAP